MDYIGHAVSPSRRSYVGQVLLLFQAIVPFNRSGLAPPPMILLNALFINIVTFPEDALVVPGGYFCVKFSPCASSESGRTFMRIAPALFLE